MTTTYHIAHDEDCNLCDATARVITCEMCGVSAQITDCGHMVQPRPIASDGSTDICWSCAIDVECDR